MSSPVTLLLGLLLLARPDLPRDVADGLYRTTDDPAAPLVTTVDGSEVRVGAPCAARPVEVTLRSRDNANTRFDLTLVVPYDAALAQALHHVLVIDGSAWRQWGAGSSGREQTSISFLVIGRAGVDAVAHHFGVPLLLRRHPGHRLLIAFTTDPTPSVVLGADVRAVLHITNVSDEPVAFMQGGRNRAERDNQFSFSATRLGRQVPDVGTSLHFGGLATRQIIAPGETFEQSVDLRKWLALDEPGVYEVLGSYVMEFSDPDDDSWHTIWEDYATASFVVRVEARAADR